jgi:hypothetical protein
MEAKRKWAYRVRNFVEAQQHQQHCCATTANIGRSTGSNDTLQQGQHCCETVAKSGAQPE